MKKQRAKHFVHSFLQLLGTVPGTGNPVAKQWKSLPSWYMCSKYIIRIWSWLDGKCHREQQERKMGSAGLGSKALKRDIQGESRRK